MTILINTTETPSETKNINRTSNTKHHYTDKKKETRSEAQNPNRTNNTKHHYADKQNRNTK